MATARLDATGPLTDSVAARALYLQALALYRTHSVGVSMPRDTREQVTRLLDEAIAEDADFAAALAWRAHVTLDSLMFDSFSRSDWVRRRAELLQNVQRDANRAMLLNPAEGTAQVVSARLQMFRGQFSSARSILLRALEHHPDDALVFVHLAMASFLMDDDEGAVTAARRALELDPRNPAPCSMLGLALRALGDRAGASAAHRRMMEQAPRTAIGYLSLARTSLDGGVDSEIVSTLRMAERFFDDTTRNFRTDVALSYARIGLRRDAERLILEFETSTAGQYVPPAVAAMARLALRDYAAAHRLLEDVIATGADGMDPVPLALIRRNSWSDPVLDEPAWRELRARLRGSG
jgi:tetratricopeptide (TPR) repeat protein